MNSPDWVGIGVMKSGTTWWHRSITDHPDAAMAKSGKDYSYPWYIGKQLHFFEQFCYREPTSEDASYYSDLFPDDKITGEWSPNYLNCFWIPSTMFRLVPNVKLLVMLRDPVERYESELSHDLKYPMRGEREIDLTWETWHVEAYQRGNYAHHLKNWFSVYPREQMLVLQYEKCKQDFEKELKKTYKFLGLDDSFLPEDRSNSNPGSKLHSLPEHIEDALRVAYRPEIEELAKMLPEIDISLWTRSIKESA